MKKMMALSLKDIKNGFKCTKILQNLLQNSPDLGMIKGTSGAAVQLTYVCMYIYISPADWDLMGSNLDKFLVYGF